MIKCIPDNIDYQQIRYYNLVSYYNLCKHYILKDNGYLGQYYNKCYIIYYYITKFIYDTHYIISYVVC